MEAEDLAMRGDKEGMHVMTGVTRRGLGTIHRSRDTQQNQKKRRSVQKRGGGTRCLPIATGLQRAPWWVQGDARTLAIPQSRECPALRGYAGLGSAVPAPGWGPGGVSRGAPALGQWMTKATIMATSGGRGELAPQARVGADVSGAQHEENKGLSGNSALDEEHDRLSGLPEFSRGRPQAARRGCMAPENLDLSVIIVTYESSDLIERCLDRLDRAMEEWGGCGEILVIDNASGDDTLRRLRSREGIRLFPRPLNLGFAAGVNVGLRQCRGRYVLLLNPDCFFLQGLGEMIAFMERRPEVAAVGPTIIDGDGKVALSSGRFPTLWTEFCEHFALRSLWPRSRRFASYLYGDWDRGDDRPVHWLTGACLMLRTSALEEVGPLDEDYFLYSEEMDLQCRLARRGWERWFLAAPQVLHLEGSSAKKHGGDLLSSRLQVEFIKSLTLFFRKQRGPVQWRWHSRLLAVSQLLRLARALLRWRPGGAGRRSAAKARVFWRVLKGLCWGFEATRAAEIRLRA